MSLPVARILCTGCAFERRIFYRPIELHYCFPDGRVHRAGRERGWCEDCADLCDREPAWDQPVLQARLSALEQTLDARTAGLPGLLQGVFRRKQLQSLRDERETLRLQLEIAQAHAGRQHCLCCGSCRTLPLTFDTQGLSTTPHTCGARLRFIDPDPDGARWSYRLQTITLSPAGQRLEPNTV